MIESLRNKVRDALPKSGGGNALHYFSEDIFCIKEADVSELTKHFMSPHYVSFFKVQSIQAWTAELFNCQLVILS